ncbi:hypothetical protein BJ741DRAFT_308337 [Chytriomyces cf. hyalinus JEL632]|nr:hypothetical protein BJ741DRAFT_308337 [Chytriomyces cf. hyalinus JEL632]
MVWEVTLHACFALLTIFCGFRNANPLSERTQATDEATNEKRSVILTQLQYKPASFDKYKYESLNLLIIVLHIAFIFVPLSLPFTSMAKSNAGRFCQLEDTNLQSLRAPFLRFDPPIREKEMLKTLLFRVGSLLFVGCLSVNIADANFI